MYSPHAKTQRDSRYVKFEQRDKYSSPWSLALRLKGVLWRLVWIVLFRPSPKPFKAWRNFLLKLFGTKITGRPFVSSSAYIRMPWNLILEDHACIGEHVDVYNLGQITLRSHCVVAQQVYLCAGTHDLSRPSAPLMVAPIIIGCESFVGVRALILPGVEIGSGAVVGAGTVVTRDVDAMTIVAGNPARQIGLRSIGALSVDHAMNSTDNVTEHK